MLSDQIKIQITHGFKLAASSGALPEWQKLGPSGVVDEIILHGTSIGELDDVAEVVNNRQEAEQIIAGCLGMM